MAAVGVFVTVTVPEDKVSEFRAVMEEDVRESRKEEGCLRFDLHCQSPCVYSFYEVFTSSEAQAFHKTTPHYKKWAEFKAGCPSVGASQTTVKFNFISEP